MGKKRIVQPEDDDLLFENIKRSKLPLEARPGLMERTEYLRQIFQGFTASYTVFLVEIFRGRKGVQARLATCKV